MKQKKRSNTSAARQGRLFGIPSIREMSIGGVVVLLLVFAWFIEPHSQVLGISTTPLSPQNGCAFYDLVCYLETLFGNQTIPSPAGLGNIPQDTPPLPTSDIVTANPAPTLIPGYKLYTDTIFHFSIAYPGTWHLSPLQPAYYKDAQGGIIPAPTATLEESHSLGFTSPTSQIQKYSPLVQRVMTVYLSTNIQLRIERNDAQLALPDFITTAILPHDAVAHAKPQNVKLSTVQVGQRLGVKVAGLETLESVFWARGNVVFELSLVAGDEDNSQQIFNTMLTTFRFNQ